MIPAARQRVLIEGRNEQYIVLAVDRETQCAYVVESRGNSDVEMVRFHALLPVPLESARPQPDTSLIN